MAQKLPLFLLLLAGILLLYCCAAVRAHARQPLQPTNNQNSHDEQGFGHEKPWRIRFHEAAVVAGSTILLGEVASPVGDIPPGTWEQLAQRELWPAPTVQGKPVNMTRPRLQEAVMRTMEDLAPYCLFPGSLALQRGGAVVTKPFIQEAVTKGFAPYLRQLSGEASLSDFRIPSYIFLAHSGQTITVEPPKKVSAGRISFRINVNELDNKVVQKLTGSVFIDSWIEVPCASAPLNKDDLLQPDHVTFIRMNLAHLRSTPWDGKGGPWRIMRPVGTQQVIYQSDLGYIPTVRKGSGVTIVYSGRNVTLQVAGEAMSDGGIGDNIPVRNKQSKKEIYGIVRDAGTVHISSAYQAAN